MRVFVLNKRGEPLMPCTQRKARLLLKEDKAVIYKYNPFTIQLTYATGETKQDNLIPGIVHKFSEETPTHPLKRMGL